MTAALSIALILGLLPIKAVPVLTVGLADEQVQELHRSDTAIILLDTRYWPGAAPDRDFIHLATPEVEYQWEGTTWFEKVTDGDYCKTPAPMN